MSSLRNIRDTGDKQGTGQSGQLVSLIRSCIDMDRSAQERLYNTYAGSIYSMIGRYIRDEHLAKDILSETFFRVFTKLELYKTDISFTGWIRKIAVHTITDHFRKHGKHIDSGGQDPEETRQSVPDEAISNISYKELLAHVHQLPHMQRTIFNLFVFEEYSHKDIAALLDISENNSRWHLNDARRRLKHAITYQQYAP